MMTENLVFLSGFSEGIMRAVAGGEGGWLVQGTLVDVDVSCLAEDHSRPGVVYAGSREQGVFRSEDTGKSWEPMGMEGHIVKSLAVDPHNSGVIFAGTEPPLIFRSDDGGESWREMEGFRRVPNRWWWFSPADQGDYRAYVMQISVSPTEPGRLIAGIELGAVVRSEDRGETWSRHLSGTLRDCHSLKFHRLDGNWAYEAGGTGGGAAYSKDGGRTWSKAKQGLEKNYGIVCAADGLKPEVWYVAVAPSPYNAYGDEPEIYLYRWDGGAGWTPIGWEEHPLHETPTALVTSRRESGHLFAGLTSGEVWHSPNYGEEWRKMPFNLGGVWGAMMVIEQEG